MAPELSQEQDSSQGESPSPTLGYDYILTWVQSALTMLGISEEEPTPAGMQLGLAKIVQLSEKEIGEMDLPVQVAMVLFETDAAARGERVVGRSWRAPNGDEYSTRYYEREQGMGIVLRRTFGASDQERLVGRIRRLEEKRALVSARLQGMDNARNLYPDYSDLVFNLRCDLEEIDAQIEAAQEQVTEYNYEETCFEIGLPDKVRVRLV